jgi:hypothetical protein
MGKVYTEGIDQRISDFLMAQPMFFVATAPAGPDGHVNVSPKGLAGSFAVLGDWRVAYLDYTGSGAETIAHLRENGRITLMFCAFAGAPKIYRLHGLGTPVFPEESRFEALAAHFPGLRRHGLRSIVSVEVGRVSDSCGFGVPLLEYAGERDHLVQWADARTEDDLVQYRRKKNEVSVDGLPALG